MKNQNLTSLFACIGKCNISFNGNSKTLWMLFLLPMLIAACKKSSDPTSSTPSNCEISLINGSQVLYNNDGSIREYFNEKYTRNGDTVKIENVFHDTIFIVLNKFNNPILYSSSSMFLKRNISFVYDANNHLLNETDILKMSGPADTNYFEFEYIGDNISKITEFEQFNPTPWVLNFTYDLNRVDNRKILYAKQFIVFPQFMQVAIPGNAYKNLLVKIQNINMVNEYSFNYEFNSSNNITREIKTNYDGQIFNTDYNYLCK